MVSNKTIINLSHRDLILWPVYITIKNFDAKTRQSQKLSEILFLGFIFIVYKRLEDVNNKNKDLMVKIYHMAFKTIL